MWLVEEELELYVSIMLACKMSLFIFSLSSLRFPPHSQESQLHGKEQNKMVEVRVKLLEVL